MTKHITPTIRPSNKQDLAYQMLDNDYTSFLLFGGGAGGGKSWFGCEWLLTRCYFFPGSRWFIGRKERTRLMSTTYVTWTKVCAHHHIPASDWKLNGEYNYIEFVQGIAKGSRIDLLDLAYKPQDPMYERFGSLEYTGGWIEEAGEVDFLCFDVLKSRIGRQKNLEFNLLPPKLLLTCNPTQNWLYRVFYKPYKNNTLPKDYAFIQSLYKDNPYTRDVYGEQLEKLTDEVLRARLKNGLWEYSNDDLALVSYDAIIDLFTNTVEESTTRYLTADIARYGSDKIVYANWRGMNLYKLTEKGKQSLVQTSEDLRDEIQKEFIEYKRAIVDEDGVGGGVVDNLQGILGFMGNRAPILRDEDTVKNVYNNVTPTYLTKPNYKNLRSQCYFMLAEKINNHEICIKADLTETQREMIIEELQQIRRVDDNPDAPLQIASKDLVKEAIGRSPDYADTLMMRMYFEIVKPTAPAGLYHAVDEQKVKASGALTPFGGIPFDIV